MRKITAILLSVALLLSFMAVPVIAEGEEGYEEVFYEEPAAEEFEYVEEPIAYEEEPVVEEYVPSEEGPAVETVQPDEVIAEDDEELVEAAAVTEAWQAAPTVTAEQTGNGEVTLTWNSTGEGVKYAIYEVVGTTSTKLTTSKVASCVLTDVSVGEHSYKVRAYMSVDGKTVNGTYSKVVNITVTEAVKNWDDPITVTAEQTGEGEVTLTWESTGDGIKYAVYEVVGTTSSKLMAVKEASCILSAVTVGEHSYKVRAYKSVDGKTAYGPYSALATVSVTASVKQWDDPVTLTAVQTGDGEVTLSWENAGDGIKYVIYEVIGTTSTKLTTAKVPSCVLTGVSAGDHSYKARAYKTVDGKSVYGAYGDAVVVTVKAAEKKWDDPLTVTAEQTADGVVTLTWESAGDGIKYAIYEVVGTTSSKLTTSKVPTCVLTGVTAGDHSYKVRAYQSIDGKSVYGAYSNIAVVSVTAKSWKDSFTVTAEQTADGEVTLTWENVGDGIKYAVYEVVGNDKSRLKNVTVASCVLTEVAVGEHSYYVRAYQSIDGKTVYGNPSVTVVVTVAATERNWKDPVVLTVEQTGDSEVKMTWESAGDGCRYQIYEFNGTAKTKLGTASALTYTRTDVTAGEHSYAVRAYQTVDGKTTYGQFSEIVSITVAIADIVVDDVTYSANDDGTLTVASYAGTAAVVTIPETIEGKTVTKIGESAFEGNTTLQSIDLPDTITVIGKRAFANCSSLSEMK